MRFYFKLYLLSTVVVSPAAAFLPISSRRRIGCVARPALIFSPDGERYDDDSAPHEPGIGAEVENGIHSLRGEILEYLNLPQFTGPLATLAAAKANVDLASIHAVNAASVSPQHLQISATSCDDTSCVNLVLDVYFPTPSDSLCQHHVIENLGVLHQQANAILASREVLPTIQRLQSSLLAEKVVFPSWWMKEIDESMQNSANLLRKIINDDQDHAEDLQELVIRHQTEALRDSQGKMLSNVEMAIIRQIGSNGIVLGATDGKRNIQVPIRFPRHASSSEDLADLVAATVDKGNHYFHVQAANEVDNKNKDVLLGDSVLDEEKSMHDLKSSYDDVKGDEAEVTNFDVNKDLDIDYATRPDGHELFPVKSLDLNNIFRMFRFAMSTNKVRK